MSDTDLRPYFVAPDGNGDETLWRVVMGCDPIAVLRKCDLSYQPAWLTIVRAVCR
jgi:hypothetical protein